MIEPSFRAHLVTAVGGTSLPAPGCGTTRGAAIAMSAITVFANPEHGAASVAAANSLTENNLAMKGHARQQGGLDKGYQSWQVRTSFDTW